MKKYITLAMLFATTTVSAKFNEPHGGFISGNQANPITVQEALKAADDTHVTLKGNIVRQLDKGDEFIFRDASGEIQIEVEDEAWNGQNITPNDQITIQGKVDTNGIMASEIEVYRIQKN